jgi:hypothetical protein
MKAAVYYETGAPTVFRYEDVPDPPLHPRGVVIDVQAVSIEGGDTLNRAGGEMPAKPHIVGYQCAGVVREAGAEVSDRKPGDRVVALMPHGSHASVVSVPAQQTWLIPDGSRTCGVRARLVGNRARLPVRVRAAEGGRDGAGAGGDERRRHRLCAASAPGGGEGDRDVIERR